MSTVSKIRYKEGEELFRLLAVAFADEQIFSPSHPRFLESSRRFLTALDDFFENHPEQRNVLFLHSKGRVFFRKVPVAALSPPAIKLVKLFGEKKVEGFRLGTESDLDSLSTVIGALRGVSTESDEPPWQQINRALEASGMKSQLGFFADSEFCYFADDPDELKPVDTTVAPSSIINLPSLELPLDLYKSTLVALSDLMSHLGNGGTPQFDELIDVTRKFTTGVVEGVQEFLPLASVHYATEHTFNHSVNVCLLVTAALRSLVKDPESLARVGQAALLHDVGKSLVPQDLLYKNGCLGEEDLEALERHCALGAEILQDSIGIDPLSVVVAYDHHRRPDGLGYPIRQRPTDVVTSLVAAADVFEALIAERPYKRSLSPAEAFGIFSRLPEAKGLESSARLLLDTLSPYPPGTVVRLDTGEYAIVSRVRKGAPDQPWVRLISFDHGGRQIAAEELSLSPRKPGHHVPRIVAALASEWWNLDPGEEELGLEEPGARQEFTRRIEEGTLLSTEG